MSTMRILCLHGYGTSGDIMRLQLDAFIRQADASYEFVFLDGEHPCEKAKAIGEFYEGPTFGFMQSVRPDGVQNALYHLQAFIEEDGPFDGVIGFSQGASLALSYLLQYEIHTGSYGTSPYDDARAFKWAVLLSTIPAFSPDPNFRSDLFANLTDDDRALLEDFPHNTSDVDFDALSGQPERAIAFRSFATLFDGCISAEVVDKGFEHGFELLKRDAAGADKQVSRILHPDLLPADVKVRIPTVHVVGARDQQELIVSSRVMEKVCDPHLVQSLMHGGGHDIPRSTKDVRALTKAMEHAIQLSMQGIY